MPLRIRPIASSPTCGCPGCRGSSCAADPRCATLPVVAVTGLASDAREADGEFSAVLMKPCTPDVLGQAIAVAIVEANGNGDGNAPLAAAKMLKRMARRR